MNDTKRGARTESLSLRIDPKTKFILDFMVRVTGFRITDLIERAIKDYADKTTVGENDFGPTKNWLYYWHPEDGTRTINMIFDKDLRTNFDEDELAEFVDQHEEFFFSGSGSARKPLTSFVQVLWPSIDEFVKHWREHKATSRWATGDLMLKAIKDAGMRGPDWPRGTKKSPKPQSPKRDLDDDIPF
jgi:hypothetical protein